MNALTPAMVHHMIELACRAPSVHNSQPWRWRIQENEIELWADRDRQLQVTDPEGRNLAISCGAALHHLVVAAQALGATATVDLCPSREREDLLARVHLRSGRPSADAREWLDAIDRRCTDRRRFTSWPVPDTRLARLAQAATGWGAYAIPVLDVTARFRAELLLGRAQTIQESDHRVAQEQQLWTERSNVDGVPLPNAAPTSRVPSGDRPNRFASEDQSPTSTSLIESSDGLMVVCTALDDQGSWLEAGQVLSALWLRATREGLSLVPLSQVIEVPETREALHHDIFAGMAHPQLLVRIGWQEIGRASLSPTPRRPIADVLID